MFESGSEFSESYPAVAESVPRVRSALTEYATGAGVGGERLDAIRLTVSEAVTNCVLHAYDGSDSDGIVSVGGSRVGGEFWLFVADDGSGLRPRGPHSGLGLGLALIAQLADEFQILSRSTGGTELRIQFKLADHEQGQPARSTRRPQSKRRPQSHQVRGSVSSAAFAA